MNINDIIREEFDNLTSYKVYHGTDNDFNEFDLNRIGTGDGRSIGGWGIYFSTSKQVADQYRTDRGYIKTFNLRNGSFFDLDGSIEQYGDMIINGLVRKGVDDNEIEEFRNDYVDYDVTNKQALDWLNYVLGGEKQASLFLKALGFDGNTFIDKTDRSARNFVVYNTSIIKPTNDDYEDEYSDEEY